MDGSELFEIHIINFETKTVFIDYDFTFIFKVVIGDYGFSFNVKAIINYYGFLFLKIVKIIITNYDLNLKSFFFKKKCNIMGEKSLICVMQYIVKNHWRYY